MSKVYFYYSAMNAGKSAVLLQSSYNYNERGMNTLVFAPAVDTRVGPRKVASRIGLSADARAFTREGAGQKWIKSALDSREFPTHPLNANAPGPSFI